MSRYSYYESVRPYRAVSISLSLSLSLFKTLYTIDIHEGIVEKEKMMGMMGQRGKGEER